MVTRFNRRGICQIIIAAALLLCPIENASQSAIAHAEPNPKISLTVIAAQVRKQGFVCEEPQSVERDASQSQDIVWLLKCKSTAYRVQPIPSRAWKIETID